MLTARTPELQQKRQAIIREYNVDTSGRIRRPGKFEGERLYVPYFWDAYLSGFADRDDGRVLGFDITADDRALFPELGKRRRTVKLFQRDDGFVVEV
jgi:hypothetical protein